MASTSSESESERQRHKKSGKKTKKRYRNKSDDDEKGYKKFKRKKEKKKSKKHDRSDSETPSLSEYGIPVVANPTSVAVATEPSASSDNYGPALPAHLKPSASRNYGPQLPSPHDEISHTDIHISDVESDLDDNCVGPLPGVSNSELEERALEIKLGHVPTSSKPETGRESWMTELPRVKGVAELGLGSARQFRTRDRPDFSDRSEWTDTPADKERKKTEGRKPTAADKERDIERKVTAKRDAEQDAVAKELKKKREKSLMELHEEKLKKARKEKDDEPQTRRPFDRNVDLQANRFDEAQKKAVVKKAQLLDSRFSSGASKYL